MLNWINTHGIEALMTFYVFNAMIAGMPDPTAASSSGYMWLYRSLHVLGGNLDKLVASNFLKPGTTQVQTFTQQTTVTQPDKKD